jgi:hypothetical protein
LGSVPSRGAPWTLDVKRSAAAILGAARVVIDGDHQKAGSLDSVKLIADASSTLAAIAGEAEDLASAGTECSDRAHLATAC